jgi:hypothetical protein
LNEAGGEMVVPSASARMSSIDLRIPAARRMDFLKSTLTCPSIPVVV